MRQISRLVNYLVWFGSALPQLLHAQAPAIVNKNMFVNANGNASLLGISVSTQSIGQVIFVRGINYALIAVGILSITYIIYNAIQLTTAAGDEAKIEQAKRALVWSLVGLVVVLGVFTIITATRFAAQGTLE